MKPDRKIIPPKALYSLRYKVVCMEEIWMKPDNYHNLLFSGQLEVVSINRKTMETMVHMNENNKNYDVTFSVNKWLFKLTECE